MAEDGEEARGRSLCAFFIALIFLLLWSSALAGAIQHCPWFLLLLLLLLLLHGSCA